MRIPAFRWDHRHNVATVWVSFANRIWHSVDVGDVVLGYAATGRLARVLFLDPRASLPPVSTEADAIVAVLDVLRAEPGTRVQDLEVLESALARAVAASGSTQAAEGRREAAS